MISVRHLVKDFGRHRAVNNVNFDAEEGRIVGFLGPNGAGKTTTIRILTGYMPPTSGSASINGADAFADSLAVRRSIGYLPESNPLYGEMRVREQLHYFGRLQGMSRADRNRRLADLTEVCGLGKIVDRPIGQLSKGNRQRVGLAQALLHDPPVLILDEPTVGLDPSQITEIRSLVRELGSRKTILLSTHILPEVERTCDKVVIIASGQVVADGTPDELKAKVRSASRVIVELKAEAADVAAAFEAHDAVGCVETTHADGWTTAAVTARNVGDDIRERLGDIAIAHRWPLRLMRHETASLEEFFVQVTNQANVSAA